MKLTVKKRITATLHINIKSFLCDVLIIMHIISSQNYKKGCIAFIDGASLNNPGNAGIGAVIFIDGEKKLEISKYIGIKTNNQAEYMALLAVLEQLAEIKADNPKIFSDSKLLVSQVNGLYKVKSTSIFDLHQKAVLAINSIKAKVFWIPREENKLADMLSKKGALKGKEV